jgi:hypothetical protein
MESIHDVTVLNDKKVEEGRSFTARRNHAKEDDQIGKMDSFEFLWMLGGGAIVGAGLYLLSFLSI